MKAIDACITNHFAAYNGDTIELSAELPSASVDFSIFSPPFASLFTYSPSERDLGNCRSYEEFFEHYGFLIREQRRVMRPGRLVAIHCMLLPSSKQNDGYIGLKDFRGDIIRAYQREGFIHHSEIVVWKCPVTAVTRTKALGLLHKQLKKDSAMSRQGIPDYVVVMRTPGDNPVPVTHTNDTFPVPMWQRYASPVWVTTNSVDDEGFGICSADQIPGDDSSGIDQSETLNVRVAREEPDEKHLCALQTEVIRRCVTLWSNPGELVWSPFMGIGSEGYVALQQGRKFVGVELKGSYYQQAVANLRSVEPGGKNQQLSLLDRLAG